MQKLVNLNGENVQKLVNLSAKNVQKLVNLYRKKALKLVNARIHRLNFQNFKSCDLYGKNKAC